MAKKLAISADRGEKVVQTIARIIKDQLLQGQSVDLPDVGKLVVEQRKGEIITNPETGIRQVLPVRRFLAFSASDAMSKAVEGMRLVNVLLLVPKNDFFARTVRFHFKQSGYTVHIETNIDDAIDFIETQSTDLVILDTRLEGTEDVAERIKCYRDTSLTPIIEIFPKNVDPEAASSFRVLTDSQLAEPFELDQLLNTAKGEIQRVDEEELLFEQQFNIGFLTGEGNLERMNNIGNVVFKDSNLDDEGQTAMSAAFREAVGNAAQHGNRDDGRKRVEVLYLLDSEKITVVITDEGEGFNHWDYVDNSDQSTAVAKARKRHKEGRVGGLGIMLMLKCVDRLEYNDKGNVITITKYLNKSE